MRQVDSSNIAGYEYTEEDCEERTGTLKVQFRNGRTYTYDGVPSEVSESFDRIADEGGSVGSYFAKMVRPHFPGVEVQD